MTRAQTPRSPRSAAPPAALPAAPAPAAASLALTTAVVRHDGWTTARQIAFLETLAATHSVSEAARVAGMSRQSAYALRARLKGEPFDLAWAAAFRCRFDVLAEAALDRAINGVEVQHYYHGELVSTSRRYDERLTLALLAMRGSFGARTASPLHPASAYAAEDFGALLERVEHGPETWDEEIAAERAAHDAEIAAAEAENRDWWEDPEEEWGNEG